MQWDPSQYLRFGGQRFRPGLDLLQRIDLDAPARVYDLGCGAGDHARAMAARWPDAAITGLDNSQTMLDKAQAGGGAVDWELADIATWQPDAAPDLIFSNAVLQWLDDHQTLLPRLYGLLKPGGVLAVQMPRNHGAASFKLMEAAALEGSWADRLKPILRMSPVAEPAWYYDVLRPVAAELDIWESEYLQVLEGDNAVLEFIRGTALKPLLEAFDDGGERAAFEADYTARLAEAYPRRADGCTLYPFRRLFIVARASG